MTPDDYPSQAEIRDARRQFGAFAEMALRAKRAERDVSDARSLVANLVGMLDARGERTVPWQEISAELQRANAWLVRTEPPLTGKADE